MRLTYRFVLAAALLAPLTAMSADLPIDRPTPVEVTVKVYDGDRLLSNATIASLTGEPGKFYDGSESEVDAGSRPPSAEKNQSDFVGAIEVEYSATVVDEQHVLLAIGASISRPMAPLTSQVGGAVVDLPSRGNYSSRSSATVRWGEPVVMSAFDRATEVDYRVEVSAERAE